MALQTLEREIAGDRYMVTQLPAPEGRKLLVKLYKVLGPVVGTMIKGFDVEDSADLSLGDLKLDSLGAAFSVLAEHLSEGDLEHVSNVLCASTQVHVGDDKWIPLKQVYDLHFAGRYLAMFKWMKFALEVNYADFFEGSGSLKGFAAQLHQTPTRSASRSQTTSTGQPGASSAANV